MRLRNILFSIRVVDEQTSNLSTDGPAFYLCAHSEVLDDLGLYLP